MKIVKVFGDKAQVSVSDAIEASITDSDDPDSIGRLRDQINKVANILGILVEKTYENGDLGKRDIEKMLSYRFEITK